MTPLLEVENLRVAFRAGAGPVEAVRGVTFSLPAAGVLAIVGESGSGKSATAAALIGLLPKNGSITAGAVRFEGRDLALADEETWRAVRGRRVALVPQDPNAALNPTLQIGRQLALLDHVSLNRPAARARAMDLLRAVGFPDPAAILARYPHEVSGGQRQRVLIAAALINDPVLIIADEPTTALDVSVQAEILALLKGTIAARRLALVFITHNLAVAAALADRVLVLRRGEMVEQGRAADVLRSPSSAYVRDLLAASPSSGPPRSRLAVAEDV